MHPSPPPRPPITLFTRVPAVYMSLRVQSNKSILGSDRMRVRAARRIRNDEAESLLTIRHAKNCCGSALRYELSDELVTEFPRNGPRALERPCDTWTCIRQYTTCTCIAGGGPDYFFGHICWGAFPVRSLCC